MRKHLFTLRMDDAEDRRARRVAGHFGLDVSGLIRMLLVEKERELGLALGKVAAAKGGKK